MYGTAKVWTITALLAAGIGLAACDEDEQGRILRYEKGKYLGPTEEPLTNEQLDELRQRVRLQQGS